MKKILLLSLVAVFFLSLTSGCGQPPAQEPEDPRIQEPIREEAEAPPAEGTAAALGSLESFTASTLDGGTFTQDDVAAADATVINFWSLTCRPCIAAMPDLADFAAALPDNVQVITVCLDGTGNEDAAAQILERAGFQGPTLVSVDGDLKSLCGNIMYTPTTLFANSAGMLVGDPVIGRRENLSEVCLAAVNQVLTEAGKDEISLENE